MAVVAVTASGEYELLKFESAAEAREKLAAAAEQVGSLTGSAAPQPPPDLWVETRRGSGEMIRYSQIVEIVDR